MPQPMQPVILAFFAILAILATPLSALSRHTHYHAQCSSATTNPLIAPAINTYTNPL
jgi:hypothetical protein